MLSSDLLSYIDYDKKSLEYKNKLYTTKIKGESNVGQYFLFKVLN